jgi:F0F1-type ATP synthase assembly protein I
MCQLKSGQPPAFSLTAPKGALTAESDITTFEHPQTMAFSNPPENKPNKRDNGGMDTLLKAEKLTQIAVILPAAVFVGWVIGGALDKWLHKDWIYIAGIVLGAVAGFVQIFRLVASTGKEIR